MPKKKRKKLGYQRPKKKVASQHEEVEEASKSDSESEEDESEDEEHVEEPAAPPPAPVEPPRAKPQLTKLQELRKAMVAAERELRKVQRKWNKTAKTHIGGKYSPWSEPSVVARVVARLQKADDELDAARTVYHERRRRYMAHRSKEAMRAMSFTGRIEDLTQKVLRLEMAMRASDLDILAWYDDDRIGQLKHKPPQKGVFVLNNEGPGVMNVVAEHFGLAQAWDLMRASDL